MFKHSQYKIIALGLLLLMILPTVQAGNVVLSNNSGTASTVWFISGEKSLVMNGFDLDNFNITRPTQLDRLSIRVQTPTPGVGIEALVYQDANGGSPADATLLRSQVVDIQSSGTFTVTFDSPVTVSERFLWVGFYLPVDFEFLADTSGSSVLTYWAWKNASTFDPANLSSADVIGPGDGSAPVNIDMGGVARITAELITDGGGTVIPGDDENVTIRQIVGDPNTDLSPMAEYEDCNRLVYDNADVAVTYKDGIDIYCRDITERFLRPDAPDGYTRRAKLYDVYVFGLQAGKSKLPYAVTHCVRPREIHRSTAIIGVAYGAPREWEILPSVRFGEWVCAEVKHAGFISYFTTE